MKTTLYMYINLKYLAFSCYLMDLPNTVESTNPFVRETYAINQLK